MPLEKGGYGFGRVLKVSGGTMFGFYDFASDKVEPPSRFAQKPYLFIIMGTDDGIESWRWKVIGTAPLRSDEFVEPDFWVRDSVDPTEAQIYSRGRYRKATAAEARHLELFKIWSTEGVEERLTQALKAKGLIK